jgi:hypothetical protein
VLAKITQLREVSPSMAFSPTLCRTSRRNFLKLAGTAAAAALTPRLWAQDAPRGPRPFEISANLYAWDLHDEGVERILDNLQEMAAINSVYLVGVMHPERRPFQQEDYAHNPIRKSWLAEDARCYWHPDPSNYGRVRPRLSDQAWLNETDWLEVLSVSARKRGLKLGVEFSHALIGRQRMADEFKDLAQINLHGSVTTEGAIKWLQPPCTNHPDTIALATGMTADVVSNHHVDFVQSCIINFDSAPPEKGGGCFCQHCKAAAREMGLDLGRIQAALLADPNAGSALGDWRDFRVGTVGRFYSTLHRTAHANNPAVDLRYNVHSPLLYGRYGVDPGRLAPHVDSMRLTNYAEQEGTQEAMDAKKSWLDGMRRQVPADFPFHDAVSMRLKATPDTIREGVRLAVASGAAGITASHYDCATFTMIRAVRDGLTESGVKAA